MAWIEVHQGIAAKRKTTRLADALGVSPLTVVGHLIVFWHYVLDEAGDGNVTDFTNQELATAAHFTGDADLFVTAMTDNKWLDRYPNGELHVHKWHDYGGKYHEKREQNAERQRRYRGSNTDKKGISPHGNADVTPRNALRNATHNGNVTSRNASRVHKSREDKSTEEVLASASTAHAPREPKSEPLTKRAPLILDHAIYGSEMFKLFQEVCDLPDKVLGGVPATRDKLAGFAQKASEIWSLEDVRLAGSRWAMPTAPKPGQFFESIQALLNSDPAKQNGTANRRDIENAKIEAMIRGGMAACQT